jgi:protein N-terminal amidase
MNWLDPPAEPPNSSTGELDTDVPPQDPQSPSMSNLNYWAARLTPLHDPAPGYGEALAGTGVMDAPTALAGAGDVAGAGEGTGGTGAGVSGTEAAGSGQKQKSAPDEVVFVACNRVGTELGKYDHFMSRCLLV